MTRQILCVAFLALAFSLLSAPASGAQAPAGPADLAKASGIQGGLVVHLGCGEGAETLGLLLDERYLVQGLDADAAKVRAAREKILAAGQAGKVSAECFDGSHLPYVDNLVNLVIDSAGTVAREEILRVLAPGGVAMTGGRKVVKPWPADIDQWTHYPHGPDNNAVAADRRAGEPRSIQWVSEPRWGRSHEELASMSAAVTADGRMFFIVDEAPLASIRYLGQWQLVARDAFNGTLLWKRAIPVWNDHLRHFRSGPAHLPRRLVAVGDEVYVTLGLAGPVAALDAASGKTIRQYAGTERTEEIVAVGGVLYLVAGTSEADRRGGGLYQRGEPEPARFRRVMAVDAASGRQLWV
jgi:SAM-dependent methyltransferase